MKIFATVSEKTKQPTNKHLHEKKATPLIIPPSPQNKSHPSTTNTPLKNPSFFSTSPKKTKQQNIYMCSIFLPRYFHIFLRLPRFVVFCLVIKLSPLDLERLSRYHCVLARFRGRGRRKRGPVARARHAACDGAVGWTAPWHHRWSYHATAPWRRCRWAPNKKHLLRFQHWWILRCFFHRGVLKRMVYEINSLYITVVVYSPLYTLNNQGFFIARLVSDWFFWVPKSPQVVFFV